MLKMMSGDPQNNRKLLRRRIPPAQVYKPSVYRYTCTGAFFLSSENQGSEGSCRGFKSQLELLTDLDHNSREGAIKDFTYMTDYDLDDSEADSMDPQTKSIVVSPALIYPESDSKNLLPEEEIIKKQEWSCYGSTEVEYLVLTDSKTGSEKIAAVAPRNVGLSVRAIHLDNSSITNVGLGRLNITLERSPNENDNNTVLPEEVPPKPSLSTLSVAKESLEKMYDFSGKVASHAKSNVVWLHDQLQDDFVNRSITAGEKVIAQIPKTIDRTGTFMGKILNSWIGNDDEEDDE